MNQNMNSPCADDGEFTTQGVSGRAIFGALLDFDKPDVLFDGQQYDDFKMAKHRFSGINLDGRLFVSIARPDSTHWVTRDGDPYLMLDNDVIKAQKIGVITHLPG